MMYRNLQDEQQELASTSSQPMDLALAEQEDLDVSSTPSSSNYYNLLESSAPENTVGHDKDSSSVSLKHDRSTR